MESKTVSRAGSKLKGKEFQFAYQNIKFEERRELIKLVLDEGLSIYQASRDLGIKNSTAKVIVRNFKKKGHIFMKKGERTYDDLTNIPQAKKVEQFDQNEEIEVNDSKMVQKEQQLVFLPSQTLLMAPMIWSFPFVNNFNYQNQYCLNFQMI